MDSAKLASITELSANYAQRSAQWLNANAVRVQVRGRIVSKRVMGKVTFVTIDDHTGEIVVYLVRDEMAAEHEAQNTWELGDKIEATGLLFRSQTGSLWLKGDAVVQAVED